MNSCSHIICCFTICSSSHTTRFQTLSEKSHSLKKLLCSIGAMGYNGGYLFFQTLIYQKQNAPYRWEHWPTVLLTLSTYITRFWIFPSTNFRPGCSLKELSSQSDHTTVPPAGHITSIHITEAIAQGFPGKSHRDRNTILHVQYTVKLPHVHTYLHTETYTLPHKASVWSFISNLSSPTCETPSLTKSLSFSSMFIQHFAAIYPDLFPAACLLKFLLIIEHSV